MSDPGYVVYGDLAKRDTVVLALALEAKRLAFTRVEETASLAYALEARAGDGGGPYLRTPEGFVLSGLHAMLDWLERVHPRPALLPGLPVRRTCSRLLEDWIELWLRVAVRRSGVALEALEAHVAASGFLLGRGPSRPDFLLAGWVECDLRTRARARAWLERRAPRLLGLGERLLGAVREGNVDACASSDDAIPISLVEVLREIGRDYHAFLDRNQRALKDGADEVRLEFAGETRTLPVRRDCERRRLAIGRELAVLAPEARRSVGRVLEPVGAWHALRLPAAVEELDPADPRGL